MASARGTRRLRTCGLPAGGREDRRLRDVRRGFAPRHNATLLLRSLRDWVPRCYSGGGDESGTTSPPSQPSDDGLCTNSPEPQSLIGIPSRPGPISPSYAFGERLPAGCSLHPGFSTPPPQVPLGLPTEPKTRQDSRPVRLLVCFFEKTGTGPIGTYLGTHTRGETLRALSCYRR